MVSLVSSRLSSHMSRSSSPATNSRAACPGCSSIWRAIHCPSKCAYLQYIQNTWRDMRRNLLGSSAWHKPCHVRSMSRIASLKLHDESISNKVDQKRFSENELWEVQIFRLTTNVLLPFVSRLDRIKQKANKISKQMYPNWQTS